MKAYFLLKFLKRLSSPVLQSTDTVITITRILISGTSSVACVQSTVQAMFEDLFKNEVLIGSLTYSVMRIRRRSY
ncbi:hypothetical protein CCR75_004984 [Bremia lactucae]|uniref:Uncharacterized protein n=1 Tax=Bremia lactucae TaxID=4779 RepID=A0A976FQ28_BRELC|nr:hypothetical protein CCR75_004984 [Bremia lactucae]